jgi:nitrogen regulatory protein P-II 1
MKLITAIIQEDRLDDVREALMKKDIGRITVGRVSGHGRQEDVELYRSQKYVPSLIEKIEVKIAVNDDKVETAIQTIIDAARHGAFGKIGDGKIFVTPLEQVVRIRTGERGTIAL